MTENKPTGTSDRASPANDVKINGKSPDEARAEMDSAIFERVRAYHPSWNTSQAAADAFLADYERMKKEADDAKAKAKEAEDQSKR
jgi:hypothetical protein